MSQARTWLVAMLSIFVAACQPAPVVLSQQAYIWQRIWSPEHALALDESRGLVSGFRILAAQLHPREGLVEARVDLDLLAHDRRPVIAVLRMDGELATLDAVAIAALLSRIINAWRAAGVNLVGVEIDYDCATSRLADYAQLLQALRGNLANDLGLSITVLPTWMQSSSLPDVLRIVDHAVLQVHSVSSPEHGLFNPTNARRWIEQFDALSPVPFWVALPSYGSSLVRDRQGNLQVESERALPIAGSRTELSIDPEGMADFLRNLRSEKVDHLLGIVWFRLPLGTDHRGWSMTTLRAVIGVHALTSQIELQLRPGGSADDLVVSNAGSLDAAMPEQISVQPATCEAADALAGYSLRRDSAGLVFQRTENATLRAGSERVIAWLRCDHPDAERLHAEP